MNKRNHGDDNTLNPTKGNKWLHGWSVGICRKYDWHWQIKTGFKDLNSNDPPSNVHTNDRNYLMRLMGISLIIIYNCWRPEQAKRRNKRFKCKS
ncbi:hypothetical protein [Candidatus Harpocratesius sp.]